MCCAAYIRILTRLLAGLSNEVLIISNSMSYKHCRYRSKRTRSDIRISQWLHTLPKLAQARQSCPSFPTTLNPHLNIISHPRRNAEGPGPPSPLLCTVANLLPSEEDQSIPPLSPLSSPDVVIPVLRAPTYREPALQDMKWD